MIDQRLRHVLATTPEHHPALEVEGEWQSWGQVRVRALSSLAGLDKTPGMRHGVVLENRPEHAATLLALLATRRRVLAYSALWPDSRLTDAWQAERPDTLFVGESGLSAALHSAIPTGCRAVAMSASTPQSEAAPGGDPWWASPDPVAIELMSSGTTGPPRRVRLGEEQLLAALRSSGQWRPLRHQPRSVSVVAMPLEHITGLWALLGAVLALRPVVLLPRFEVEPWVAAIERHRVRAAFLVPTALQDLLDARVSPRRLDSLDLLSCGAGACPADLATQVQHRYGVPVLPTYGATEFAGALAGWDRELHRRWWSQKAGSSGRPYPGVALRTVHSDGTPCPMGTDGLLEVRTSQATTGDHGWQRTSDLARIDRDGFLWVTGRADAVIQRGGFKVRPEDVELVLSHHPSVRQAAVTDWPDDRLGAVPVAAVEMRPGHRTTEAELIAHCRVQLAPYEIPRRIAVTASISNPVGKVSREAVHEAVRALPAAGPHV